MVGFPPGLKALANAALDPGALSFVAYGDDRQRLHRRGSRKPILRKMIRKPSGPPDVFVASTAVISCAAQPGFDAPVPAALRTLFG